MPIVIKKKAKRPPGGRIPLREMRTDAPLGKGNLVRVMPRATIPPRPDENIPKYVEDDLQTGRAEILMMKGVRDPHTLIRLLGLGTANSGADLKRIHRIIEKVHARWELFGGNKRKIDVYRGESLFRLDTIENELWSTLREADGDNAGQGADVRAKVAILKTISEVNAQRNSLLGLTPKTIERLLIVQDDQALKFSERIASHEALSRVAARMLEMIEQRAGVRKVIDHVEQPEKDHDE